MSNFIISMKNPDPCTPEYYYYGGGGGRGIDKKSIRCDIDWVSGPSLAQELSKDESIDIFLMLSDVGFDDMKILEIKTSYEAIDQQDVNRFVIEAKTARIIGNMDTDDVKFLTSCGILNLTNVT